MTKCGVEILPDELQNELQKIALGACFLGSGGGGGLDTSFKYIHDHIRNHCKDKKIKSLKIADLDTAQGPGIVVAYMGAPQKMGGVKCPDAVCDGVKKYMDYKGAKLKDLKYIIPVEIGPISMIAACLTAHRLDIPVLDVDGAGRAVPTLDLITYTTNGNASVNPTMLCSEKTKKTVISGEQPGYHQITLEISEEMDENPMAASKMESLARPVLDMPLFDQKAGLVMWYFEDVTKLFKVDHDTYPSVPGTLTFCQKLGGAIQSMQGENWEFSKIEELFKSQSQSIYPAIKENYPAIKEMCRGKLISATTSTAGGFDVGVITIEDEGDSARHYTIIFQNESLILWDSNSAQPLVMAPDLISYLIEDGKYVYTNGDIMHGNALKKELNGAKIVVYGIAAPNALRTSAMQSNTMKVLNALGYYGKHESLKE